MSEHLAIDRQELSRETLNEFVDNPGLTELASLFGVPELPEDRKERLAVLQKIAADHWDFRKGAERQAVDWNDELLDQPESEQWNTVFSAASKLGMVESSLPKNRRPKYLAILGGANRAPLDRLRYGLDSVEDFDTVVYLGSSRPVSDAEREKAKDYAPHAQTEFDLGCGAIETQQGARLVSQDRVVRGGDVWAWQEYEFEIERDQGDGTTTTATKTAFALSTPRDIHEGDKTRRATTYDNYRFLASMAELADDPDASVVAVTTGFYVPGQHLPAVQVLTLGNGTPVETIGHDAAYSGAVRKPSQLLQEAKSAIDAAVRLEQALDIPVAV